MNIYCLIFFIHYVTSEDLWVQCSNNLIFVIKILFSLAIIFVFFKPVLLKLQCESESPERLLKPQISGAHSQFLIRRPGVGMRTCITYRFLGDADAGRHGNLATALSHVNCLTLQFNLVGFNHPEIYMSPWFGRIQSLVS